MISHILQVTTFSAAHFCRPLGSKFSRRKRSPKEEDSFFPFLSLSHIREVGMWKSPKLASDDATRISSAMTTEGTAEMPKCPPPSSFRPSIVFWALDIFMPGGLHRSVEPIIDRIKRWQ